MPLLAIGFSHQEICKNIMRELADFNFFEGYTAFELDMMCVKNSNNAYEQFLEDVAANTGENSGKDVKLFFVEKSVSTTVLSNISLPIKTNKVFSLSENNQQYTMPAAIYLLFIVDSEHTIPSMISSLNEFMKYKKIIDTDKLVAVRETNNIKFLKQVNEIAVVANYRGYKDMTPIIFSS